MDAPDFDRRVFLGAALFLIPLDWMDDDAMTCQQRINAAVAAQKAADQVVIDGLNAQIDTLTQQLYDCQHPPQKGPLWGANCGGYRVTMGESAPDAYARIKKGFGKINIVRWWANGIPTWGSYPSYFDQGIPVAVEINGSLRNFLNDTTAQANLKAFFIAAAVRTIGVGWHEPEKDVFTAGSYTVAEWQRAQMLIGSIAESAGNSKVTVGPVLMGGSYNPSRYTKMTPNGQNIPADQWLNYDLGQASFIGGDFYQWGSSDAGADPTSRVLDPAVALAKTKGKQLGVFELGAVARALISDNARLLWYQGMKDIVDANPGLFNCICTFESDNPPNGPYCLLAPPGKVEGDPAYSPITAAYYKSICTS